MKNTSTEMPAPADLRQVPLHDAISRQAYTLWESYGHPEGRDLDTWLEAERQVLDVDPEVRSIAPGTASPQQ